MVERQRFPYDDWKYTLIHRLRDVYINYHIINMELISSESVSTRVETKTFTESITKAYDEHPIQSANDAESGTSTAWQLTCPATDPARDPTSTATGTISSRRSAGGRATTASAPITATAIPQKELSLGVGAGGDVHRAIFHGGGHGRDWLNAGL